MNSLTLILKLYYIYYNIDNKIYIEKNNITDNNITDNNITNNNIV